MTTIKALIWAGNLKEADRFCSDRGLDSSEYRYISRADGVYGLQPTVIYRVGSYRKHRDFQAIESFVDICRVLGCQIVTPTSAKGTK